MTGDPVTPALSPAQARALRIARAALHRDAAVAGGDAYWRGVLREALKMVTDAFPEDGAS